MPIQFISENKYVKSVIAKKCLPKKSIKAPSLWSYYTLSFHTKPTNLP